jgi:PAS domain S-box-containing protein
MPADADEPGVEGTHVVVGPGREQDEGDGLLLAAAVGELRERAERLHEATEALAAQNERLLEARAALEDERARYRELFELAPDAFLLTDESGRVVEANDRASGLLGFDDASLAGTALAEFVDEPHRNAFRESLRELAASAGRRTAELMVTPRGGRTLHVEATVATVPQRNDGGALLWLLRDVTERVGVTRSLGERLSARTDELERTREEADRERIHLRDLLQRLHEGVVAVDAGGNVVYANGTAKQLFLPARLAEGQPLPDPWPEVDLMDLVRSLFTARPRIRDHHVSTPAGRVLAVRGIPALRSATAGLVVSDVTTRERRDRAEREFVANAAHELRTPLAAITGAIEVLQRGAKDVPDERDRFLAHIDRESVRLTRLTASLLALARAEMGVEAPRLELVPVRRLLEQVAAETRPASGVRVDVVCAPELVAFGNETLLEQALGNLASNAAKYTRDGTITIGGVAQNERWIVLEVADTGPGIQPEEQARVTERFQRAGAQEGFGLGLAIAAQAARALGGRLELDSEPGRGTTARIVVPAAGVVRRA